MKRNHKLFGKDNLDSIYKIEEFIENMDSPWADMAGMRDKIAHFYFGIDYTIVWKVTKERLPEIKLVIQKIFEEMEE